MNITAILLSAAAGAFALSAHADNSTPAPTDAPNKTALSHPQNATDRNAPKTDKAALIKAAENNDPAAQVKLAKLYMEGEEPEFPKAAKLLRQARKSSDSPEILYLLAQCCLQEYEAVDAEENEGETLMLQAAMGGWPDAQFTRGLMCECDRIPNMGAKEAAEWYEKAASKGHAEAQYRLGLLYRNGQGVSANETLAFRYFHAAARGGNADAQYELGQCYETGAGIAKNIIEALKWYDTAAKNGSDAAKTAAEKLKKNK